jgi:hypothetical protein
LPRHASCERSAATTWVIATDSGGRASAKS